ncbi:MAG: hypothetical protein COC05_03495 [Gammaproteobacteria bacterium]|nr:MAG: hypothetical protein COC05_03495 [Gammaproteobacteria bacterium]
MNTQAHGVLDSSKFESTPIPVVSNNIGRLHGYTIPFAQSVEAGSKGQYADANQFGRITAYGNAINKKHDISEGIYARIGEYGRLSGYSRPKIIYDQTNIVSR